MTSKPYIGIKEFDEASEDLAGHRSTGTLWASNRVAADIITDMGTQISHTGLGKRFKKIPEAPTRIDTTHNGIEYVAHRLQDAEKAVADLAKIKITLDESGIYTSPDGKKWATVSAMVDFFGVSKTAVVGRIESVPRMKARHHLGKPTWVYDLEMVETKVRQDLLNARENHEVQVDSKGYYQDETFEGEKGNPEQGLWCTVNAFWDSLSLRQQKKTTLHALRRHANRYCRTLEAVDRHGRPNATVYPVTELKSLAVLTQKRVVDPHTGIYTDPKGRQWASRNTWTDFYRVSLRAFDRGVEMEFDSLEELPSITAIGKVKGREDELFEKKAVLQCLSYIFEADLLIVNEICTILHETEGQIRQQLYLTADGLKTIFPEDRVSRKQLQRKLADYKLEAVNRDNGSEKGVFSLQAALEIFGERIRDILDNLPKAEELDDMMTLSAYLEEHEDLNPLSLVANTDILTPQIAHTSEAQITYLYSRKELDNIAQEMQKAA